MNIVERLQIAIDNGVPLNVDLNKDWLQAHIFSVMREAKAEILRLQALVGVADSGQSFNEIKQEIKRGK